MATDVFSDWEYTADLFDGRRALGLDVRHGGMFDMVNTLGLDDDLDSVEVVIAIKDAFEVQIENSEAEAIYTVGQIYELLLQKIAALERGRKCAGAMAFYRLRAALPDASANDRITPSFDLSCFDHIPTRTLFGNLEKATGLRLPKPTLSWTGKLAFWMMLSSVALATLAMIVGVVFFSKAIVRDVVWISLSTVVGCCIVGAILIWLDPRRLPDDCRTLGDLARRTAVSSYGSLVKMGAAVGAPDVWRVLIAVLSDFSGVPSDQINRETYFLRSSSRAKANVA